MNEPTQGGEALTSEQEFQVWAGLMPDHESTCYTPAEVDAMRNAFKAGFARGWNRRAALRAEGASQPLAHQTERPGQSPEAAGDKSLTAIFASAWRIVDKDGRNAASVWTEDQAIAEQTWQDEHNARWSPHRIVKPGAAIQDRAERLLYRLIDSLPAPIYRRLRLVREDAEMLAWWMAQPNEPCFLDPDPPPAAPEAPATSRSDDNEGSQQ